MAEDPKVFPSLKKDTAVPTPAPSASRPEESQNVFTELFGEDKAMKAGKVMDAVTSKSEETKKSFFSFKKSSGTPKLSKAAPLSSKANRSGRAFMQLSLLFLVIVLGASYSQNAASFTLFGNNPTQKEKLAETQVLNLETEIIVQKHLSSVLLLDQFSGQADEYFYALEQVDSEFTSSNTKESLEKDLDKLQPEMIEILTEVQGNLSTNLTPEQQSAATQEIAAQIEELKAKTGEVSEESLLDDIQDLESAQRLMDAGSFISTIQALSPEEITDEEIETVWTDFNNEINQSVTALINSVKASRVTWSAVFTEFERVAKVVDPLFDTEFQGNLALGDLQFIKAELTGNVSGDAVTD
ncbi:MAG: hypothetical protein AAB802_04880, partial [Patescibacteria group bacterium]